ncbi:hypothetical protein GBA63_18950 [Rubrobacter tropicus]|uniref:Uncharacterized protein n=1 Tax=Rubrobacter tropicus TaxID=2653851 RepID=A0A6G8QE18_9ACTN|nr:hypothetical protein [Rubrobacter tropicus]QIN84487.1 hypothetical protein GBA63_18950 [Rubrobacter tropicus]
MSRVAEKTAVEIRAEGDVGTICLMGPCALCGRNFGVQNGQTRLVAHRIGGGRLGLVCFGCASAGTDDDLAERLISEARRLRLKASRLERLVKGGVAVEPASREAATTARTIPRDGL